MKTAFFVLGAPVSGKTAVAWALPGKVRAITAEKAELARTIAVESEDFVYDGLGVSSDRAVQSLLAAQAFGWYCVVYFVSAALETCLRRNAGKYAEAEVKEQHSLVPISFEIVSRYADETRLVLNEDA